MSKPYSAWIKAMLSLWPATRRNSLAAASSQIVDGSWYLSGDETKNKQLQSVPLSKQALALVNQLLEQEGEFLIKSGRAGDNPINGFSKAKAQLDRLSGVTGWKIHDIRRTVATNLTKLGVDRFLLQKVVNHTDSSVTKIYDHYNYLDGREALQQWADRLDDIVR